MDANYESILADLEGRTSDLDSHLIANEFERALAALGDAEVPERRLLRAECIAFSFTEGNRRKKAHPTYFRPQFTRTDSTGIEHDFPPLSTVDATTLEYWGRRARATQNPFLQARYSDLVWDLSRPATEQKPDVAFARLAIDASLAAVQGQYFKHVIWAICRLNRALDLSISLRDSSRTHSAVAAMIAFEDHLSRDRATGRPWGLTFDAVVIAKAPVDDAIRAKLLADMEEHLERMACAEQPDPPSMEPVLDRLLTYYRRLGGIDDQRRVIRKFTGAVRRFAEQAPPLMASSWLDSTHELLDNNGMKPEADALALQMSEIGEKVGAALHENPVFITVPTADSDNYAATILDCPLDQAFYGFCENFIVRKATCEEHLRRTTEQDPIMGMIATEVHDVDGRKVASAGSVEDDFEGRVTLVAAQLLEIAVPFLRRFIQRFWEVHALTSDKVVDFIGDDSIFPQERLYVVRRGLQAYEAGDCHVASCVLLPEIEAALRHLLHSQAGSIYKRTKSGGNNHRNLDEILRDDAVVKALTEPIAFYLRTLLTEQRGWNLRNQLLHGLVDPNYVAQAFADRVLHVVILLACVRLNKPPQQQQGEDVQGAP
jgi:Domain of unknown function (DUF4209)